MGLAAMLFFTAIKYMPLADAISVFFVEPIIVMLMSAVFLGEKVGWRRLLAAVVGFMGAIIVIRPSYELFGLVSLLPLCTAFLFSIYLILTRVSGGNDNPLIMQFFAGIGGVVLCGSVLMVGTPLGIEDMSLTVPQESRAWALLLAIRAVCRCLPYVDCICVFHGACIHSRAFSVYRNRKRHDIWPSFIWRVSGSHEMARHFYHCVFRRLHLFARTTAGKRR